MGSILAIGSDFEAARVEVIAAMLYPRDERLRAGYALRKAWLRRIENDASFIATSGEIKALLELPSRDELQIKADDGIKHGIVAGDLLGLIYEQWKCDNDEPSMRAAHRRYRDWALGKKYGDGKALKYSTGQLTRYFDAAMPSAHLWTSFRLLKTIDDGGASYRAALTPQGLPLLLGVARSVQNFAETFIPKRASPPSPIISGAELHRIPDHISSIDL